MGNVFADIFWAMNNKSNQKETDKMTLSEYQKLAQRTSSAVTMGDKICNGVLGLSGESGEVADILKKYYFQGHQLDKEHMIDEAGDVLWYIAELAVGLGVTLEDIAKHNIEKLEKRYPKLKFEAERSIHRKEDET